MKKKILNLEKIEYKKQWKENVFKNKLNKKIETLSKLMNNSKWFKLFQVLEDNDMNINVKFLLDNSSGITLDNYFSYKTGIEYCHKECEENVILAGVSSYKEIEWIKIMESVKNGTKIGIDEMENVINNIGKIE